MEKEKNVIEYYVLCNKLKNVIRKGWKDWNVSKDRIESVAEHVYGVQMLALAMYSEYNYDIDIKKVLMMLSIHELEEIVIGDLTLFDISKEEKLRLGHNAVDEVLSSLSCKDKLKDLVIEFDERKTEEAKFAFFCDKLEADLQAEIYSEEDYVDLNNQPNNPAMKSQEVIDLINTGKSFGELWLQFSRNRYNYDDNFQKVSEYATKNKIKNK
ncbi:MAG: HD domain-containing protein [Bacilli bacterium]|nr:HD domain-containing protein [Bacilli bacterium]